MKIQIIFYGYGDTIELSDIWSISVIFAKFFSGICDTFKNIYCSYGMTIPQKISLTFNKADNDLPIFFTNSLVNWKFDSQLFKEPLS